MPPSTMSEANTSAIVPSSNSTCIMREIVDVVVVAADVAFVAEAGQPRDGVRPGGDRLRADRLAVARAAFDALQVQRGRQRMAALADQHAAAAAGRVGVIDRVRAAVGLLAVDPEDLPAGLLQNLPLLLDRRGVDPVLGVEQPALALPLGREHPLDAGQRRFAGRPACRPGPSGSRSSRRRNSRSAASRRSTNLSRCKPGDGDRLVGHRRHADVDRVDLVEQGVERVEEADAALLGVGRRLPSRRANARRPPRRWCRRPSARPRNETSRRSPSRQCRCEWFSWSWADAVLCG